MRGTWRTDRSRAALRGVTASALARLERLGTLFPWQVFSSTDELPVQMANAPDGLVGVKMMYTKGRKKQSYDYIVQVDARGLHVRVGKQAGDQEALSARHQRRLGPC